MDGPPPPEEDFSQLSISERLAHKNWKARVSAYETLIKTFQNTASDTDPAFSPYTNNPDTLKKIVTDANAVAQEKGVETVVTFVKFAGENAARTKDLVVPALVDKCFGSSRSGTKNQAIELVLQYAEVDNTGSGVVNDILPGLAAKQPKAVAGSVAALKSLVKTFGTQVVPPPPILKALPKIFAHTDKTVRAEGTSLTQALYQCIGPAIEPWLADLKPVQVKELKESFDKMDSDGHGKGTFKPERYTRAQQREMETGAGEDDAGGINEEPAEMDPRAFAEEVDITPKLPSGMQAALTSSKWKERKEVLDDLFALLNATPRVKDAPELSEVVKLLAGRMTDANINCVIVAANCIEALAKAMMNHFAKFRDITVNPMIERLKERKQSVTDAIGNALDAVFSTTTLPDILENILPALGHKNPQVKEGTMKFLSRCLSTSPVPPAAPQIKPLSESLAGLLEDSFEGARNEAANCLGTLMKIVGERPLNAIMDQLAEVRKVKVKEAFEKATVKCKGGSAAATRAPASKASAPAKTAPASMKSQIAASNSEEVLLNDTAPLKPKAKPPARLMAKKALAEDAPVADSPPAVEPPKPAAKPPARLMQAKKPSPAAAAAVAAAAASSSKGAKPAPVAPSTLDAFKYKHTPEDADVLAAELIPAQIATDFADANWKTRLAALEEMTNWVEGAANDIDSEVVIRFLAKKGWSEKNFQVSAKLYGILSILAERCPTFGRSSVALASGHLSEKLGDMKLKKPAGETLLLFAEKTSLQFVLNQIYDPLGKQKAPKMLADSLSWIEMALNEFGVAGLSLRPLIDFLKTALGNSNAAVRTAATKTLVTIKLFVGPGVKDLLGELNPQLLSTILSEFDKIDGQAAPEPSRTSVDVQNMAPSGASGKNPGANAMDDLFPRVELDGLLRGTTILADSKSDAWKTKKEALETLQAILDQGPNKRLKPTMGEIGQVLKARVTDTNKAVQLLALDIVARVAIGMGKPFEKHTRFFALPVSTVLADQKVNIRQVALATLSAIAEACEGVESLVHGLATALESANPLQRSSLLNWIADWFKEHAPNASLDLSPWAAPIVNCLDDRNGDVRKAAQAALPFVVAQAGYDYVFQQTNSLKPASRSTVVPLIKAAAANLPEKSSKPAPAPSSSSTKVMSARTMTPPPRSPPPAAPGSVAPASKLAGVRRKLPQGSIPRPDSRASIATSEDSGAPVSRLKPGLGGLKRPTSTFSSKPPSSVAHTPAPSSSSPFVTTRLEVKKARLAKDGTRWVIESGPVRKDMVDALQVQMEPHVSKELFGLLFSHDHNAVNDYMNGLSLICDFYSSLTSNDDKYGFSGQDRIDVGVANADLALKYVSIRVHETQPNLISKCMDVVENVMAFFRDTNYQLTDAEALCFVPTIIYKIGDPREAVRLRVQQVIQTLPKIYAYSRIFHLLMDYGLKSKIAKARQGSMDEITGILTRAGISACDPSKAFPVMASCISDKDASVRKSALTALSQGYILVGESIWSYVGALSPKDKTQLEERLRRVAGPSNTETSEAPVPSTPSSAPSHATRFSSGVPRPGSRVGALGGLPRPSSPAGVPTSRLARPMSPARNVTPPSPVTAGREEGPTSPVASSRLPKSGLATPSLARPKSFLPSRLGAPRASIPAPAISTHSDNNNGRQVLRPLNGSHTRAAPSVEEVAPPVPDEPEVDGVSLTISKILSSDPTRSVDALKQIQRILEVGPEEGPSSPDYRELSDHTEGLMETVTLQMNHVFENSTAIDEPENFRLAKHLIQTINAFCDHPLLAESVPVEILTGLFEELTLRLLQTDESGSSKVKDLSKFINMIILRLFATCRRMTVLRALFTLLLQIVKPFPANGTFPDSKEAKVAELVLKCIWKLARSIPADLEKQELDPVELFPAIEHFLQSIPPNEWRARATNKVPSGDMPLRTIKVIIQHVVAHYGDEVYDFLSSSFDDPSATIVYPYVYRILNSNNRNNNTEGGHREATNGSSKSNEALQQSPTSPPARSSTQSYGRRDSTPSQRTSQSVSVAGGGMLPPPEDEPDPDEQLLTIIKHISDEATGAMHKEGITELHQFLKKYPHKKSKVDKMLDNTGPAFRKYIARALASRAAEDEERDMVVADTLSILEQNSNAQYGSIAARNSLRRTSDVGPAGENGGHRASVTSNGSSEAPGETF